MVTVRQYGPVALSLVVILLGSCRSGNGGVVHLRRSQQTEDSKQRNGVAASVSIKAPSGPTALFEARASMRVESSWCRLRNTYVASGSAFTEPTVQKLKNAGYNVTSDRRTPFDIEVRLSGVLRACASSDMDGDLTLEFVKGESVVERSTKRLGTQDEWAIVGALFDAIKDSPRVAQAIKGKVIAIAPVAPLAPVAASAPTVKAQPWVETTQMAVSSNTSMLVVPLKCVRGVAKDTCPLITNYMMSQFQSVKNLRTVGQDDINAVLGVDKQKQAIGCGDVSCMAEIGGALGVDLVMYGELGVLGSKYNINVSAVRTSNASVAARASLRCDKTEDALADNLPILVRDVVNGINAAPTAAR
ncbi:MAG: hypothetical protein H7Z43_06295 [Clostridia bacterium]|nr:hypothetical protein [Deltaproteobacteria bacterium]